MNDESSSSESDSDSKQEKVLLALFLYIFIIVICFKANVCGSFSSIQHFSHFCLITWPLYSDHTTSDRGVLGTASAQLFSDTWLEFCLSRVKSVLRTGESSMTLVSVAEQVGLNATCCNPKDLALGYKTFLMPNSTEHEIYHNQKY